MCGIGLNRFLFCLKHVHVFFRAYNSNIKNVLQYCAKNHVLKTNIGDFIKY